MLLSQSRYHCVCPSTKFCFIVVESTASSVFCIQRFFPLYLYLLTLLNLIYFYGLGIKDCHRKPTQVYYIINLIISPKLSNGPDVRT